MVQQQEWDRLTAQAVPLLAMGLGLVLMLAAFFRLQPADTASAVVGTTVMGLTGAGLALAAILMLRNRPPDSSAHQVATVVVVIAAIGMCVAMATAEDLRGTMYVQLLLVSAGAVLLRRVWFVASVVAVWCLWLSVVALLSGSLQAEGYMLAMISATIIAVVLHALRRDSVAGLTEAIHAAENLSIRDALTGLLNRRGMREIGEELLAVARRTREPLACTFIDVDGLKKVNDTHGHDVGDVLIQEVAASLEEVFREADVQVRWGGDEFVVLSLGPGPRVEDVERRMVEVLRAGATAQAGHWIPAVSGGRVVHMPWQEESLERLLERADEEMYRRRRLKRAREADWAGDPMTAPEVGDSRRGSSNPSTGDAPDA
jgi:diguanylate cyclase (GGDEF)-like protein